MYSMQRPKLVVGPSIDQVKFFYKFSTIMSKNNLFKGLKLNIFEKFNVTKLKQGYRMHIKCQINKKTKFMKNFRLLIYLMYRL